MNDIDYDDSELPVYQWNRSKEHYSLASLAKILLTDCVPLVKLCTKQPVQVCRNVCFVVDLRKLDDPVDLSDRETWGTKSNHFKISRTYCHASSPDFSHIITVINGKYIFLNKAHCDYEHAMKKGFIIIVVLWEMYCSMVLLLKGL